MCQIAVWRRSFQDTDKFTTWSTGSAQPRRSGARAPAKSALVNGGGTVHQQLLDLQAVGNFGQAQHASIQHCDPTGPSLVVDSHIVPAALK
jgi:hypothetical protein